VTAAGDECAVWDVHAGTAVRSWHYESSPGRSGDGRECFIFDLALRADDGGGGGGGGPSETDALVACALSDGTVRIHDLRAPTPATVLTVPGAARLTAVGWRGPRRGGRGDALVACAGNGSLHIWDAAAWRPALTLRGGHDTAAYGASWRLAEKDDRLASWSADGAIAWWDARYAAAAPAASPRRLAAGVAPIRGPERIVSAGIPLFHCTFADDGAALVAVGGRGSGRHGPEDELVASAFVFDLPGAAASPPRKRPATWDAAADAADATPH